MFYRKQKQQFKELVEVKFHEWLLEMGHRQELDSLIPSQINGAEHMRTGQAVGESSGAS